MIYRICHQTTFRYSQPIRESVMELRMQPRSEPGQRCLEFGLTITPNARAHSYTDHLGNIVHYFDIPAIHQELHVEAASLVERQPHSERPASVARNAWDDVDRSTRDFRHWDWVHPSHFAQPTERLKSLVEQLRLSRRDDPFSALKNLNSGLHGALIFAPKSTRVDSPIDDCLEHRRGVCQDFAHVFIAAARLLGVPCRYVSGHLFHRADQPTGVERDASHAWAEALLPELGWVGFDPANDSIAGDEHVRVSVGRDYQDVPPTRGVFKGMAESEMIVRVEVSRA